MVEPLLQPATSEGEEAADEVIQVLEDKAAPVAELNAPADAPAATESKAWSLSLGNPHNMRMPFGSTCALYSIQSTWPTGLERVLLSHEPLLTRAQPTCRLARPAAARRCGTWGARRGSRRRWWPPVSPPPRSPSTWTWPSRARWWPLARPCWAATGAMPRARTLADAALGFASSPLETGRRLICVVNARRQGCMQALMLRQGLPCKQPAELGRQIMCVNCLPVAVAHSCTLGLELSCRRRPPSTDLTSPATHRPGCWRPVGGGQEPGRSRGRRMRVWPQVACGAPRWRPGSRQLSTQRWCTRCSRAGVCGRCGGRRRSARRMHR